MVTPTKSQAIKACYDIESKPDLYGPEVVRVIHNTRVSLEKIGLLCPKCGHSDCNKDGTTVRRGGEISATRCKNCGYRGPTGRFS